MDTACIAIERCARDGPIAIVGIARNRQITQLVRGTSLSREALTAALCDARTIVTYDGESDIQQLASEFPDIFPAQFVCLDAREFVTGDVARLLDGQFDVARPEVHRNRREIALGMWRLHERGLADALDELLTHNRENVQALQMLTRRRPAA